MAQSFVSKPKVATELPETEKKQEPKQLLKTVKPVRTSTALEKDDSRPSEFTYDYDFDENGVLYFLGSNGKTKVW